jgi:hypothetical protein
MSGALPSAIRSRLAAIGELYRSIVEVTSRVAENFSFDALDEALKKRALILQRIAGEESELRAGQGAFRWAGTQHTREIREHISAIMDLDRSLEGQASDHIARVKQDLCSLSDTSHAARAYTRNSRA